MVSAFIFLKNPFLPNISHINLVKCAAMYARIVYTITKIKNDESKIAKATIESPDIQNIVVRNAKGDIIAKGALYMNRKFGYGVINDFEINSRYKAHEDVYGDYNVAPGSRDEHERDMIFKLLCGE